MQILLDKHETRRRAGNIGNATLTRWVQAGKFPAPVAVSKRKDGTPAKNAWVEEEVNQWVRDRAAERGAGAPKAA